METQFFVMAGGVPVAHVPTQDVMHDLFVGLGAEFRDERMQGLSFSGLSQTNRSRCAELLSEIQAVQDGKHGEQLRAVCLAASRMMRQIEAMDPPAASPALEIPAAEQQAPAEPQTPERPAQDVLAEEVGRLLHLVGDGEGVKILSVARDQSLPADQRMRALVEIDKRMEGYDSTQWADLLQVTTAAIRQTDFWKTRKQRKEWGE